MQIRYKLKKGVKRFLRFSGACLIVMSYFVLLTNVIALTTQGEGEHCLMFDMDPGNYPVSSITINGHEWNKNDQYMYYNNEDTFTIIVKAGKDGEEYPYISTAQGMDQYTTYTAIENPDDDPEVVGDEYLLTLIVNNLPFQNNEECRMFGVSLSTGPFPVYQTNEVEGDISITISGDELEYHYDAQHLDEADVTYFKFDINGGTDAAHLVPFTFRNANYVYNDNEPPKNVSSVNTIEPIHYSYPYDGTGVVTFCVNGGGTDEYTHIVINGVDYENQAPHSKVEHFESMMGWAQMFCIEGVPYNEDGYTVEVTGEATAEENRIPGFGWNYLSAERSEDITAETEGNFAHGRLEFVSAKYVVDNNETIEIETTSAFNNYRYHGKGQIFQWNDGLKNYPEEERWRSWGEAQLPYGTELTVRIVPDEGYQLVRLATSPNGFQATGVPGEYKIVLSDENFSYSDAQNRFDLNPEFRQIGATVVTESEAVSSGTLQVAAGENQFTTGTPKLQVNDVASMSPQREEDFVEAAETEGYEINNYLEISLYNALYKGGKVDANNNYLSWDTEVNNLTNDATITLEFEEDLNAEEVAVVHEIRENGEIVDYEIINGTYDSNAKTITFDTKGFSTYAIAVKGTNNNNGDPDPDPNPDPDPDPPVAITHEVSFNSCGGTEIGPIEVEEGQKATQPEDPTNGDMVFAGWFEDDAYNEPFDFSTPITKGYTLFAKWDEPERVKDTDYTANDESGENSISFREETGHTYDLTIINYLDYTKEEVLAMDPSITEEEYDQMIALLNNTVKSEGELIGIYEIILMEDGLRELHEGPFNIKIFATPEMKQYNTLKEVQYE